MDSIQEYAGTTNSVPCDYDVYQESLCEMYGAHSVHSFQFVIVDANTSCNSILSRVGLNWRKV